MLALCLLIGALCVVFIAKANRAVNEETHVEVEESSDWQFPPKWRDR